MDEGLGRSPRLHIAGAGNPLDPFLAHERLQVEDQDDAAVSEDCGADRKSTRLNSSHSQISYAVFCLKKKTSRSPPRAGPRPKSAAPSTPTTWCAPSRRHARAS